MRSTKTGLGFALAAATVISTVSACGTVPTGPSLANVAFSPAIQTAAAWRAAQQPTVATKANDAFDPTVCCCHLTGTLTNNNSVPVYVIMTVEARDANDQPLGRLALFFSDMQPGEQRAIDLSAPKTKPPLNTLFNYPGSSMPCSQIDHVNYQLNVTSAGQPAPLS